MPPASRKSDSASGHGCFPASVAIQGSPDVDINGVPALRQGDAVAAHGCSSCVAHSRAVFEGSSTIFVNGKPLARVGDAIDCGGFVAEGSGDVFAN